MADFPKTTISSLDMSQCDVSVGFLIGNTSHKTSVSSICFHNTDNPAPRLYQFMRALLDVMADRQSVCIAVRYITPSHMMTNRPDYFDVQDVELIGDRIVRFHGPSSASSSSIDIFETTFSKPSMANEFIIYGCMDKIER